MKLDKFKNKSKSRFISEKEKHGKKDRRNNSRKGRIRNKLKSAEGNITHFPYKKDGPTLWDEDFEALEYEEYDDIDLDKFEKMG